MNMREEMETRAAASKAQRAAQDTTRGTHSAAQLAPAADHQEVQLQDGNATSSLPPRPRETRCLPRSGKGERGASVGADAVGEHEQRLCIGCSKCGLGVEDVLLLSCHHHLCLLCAARAAQAWEQPSEKTVSRTVSEVGEGEASSQPAQQSDVEVLVCPVCEVHTLLSASATAVVRQQLHFFENPPGCCFDAGPVACASLAALPGEKGAARARKSFWVVLCSQCEQKPAEVFCRSCVRRFCGRCAVEIHKDDPRLLTHPFRLLRRQRRIPQQIERDSGLGAPGADVTGASGIPTELPQARLALQQAAQHMRTIDDRSSLVTYSSPMSSSRYGSSLDGREGGQEDRKEGRSLKRDFENFEEDDSVHSSAIQIESPEQQEREAEWEGVQADTGPLEGAVLLRRLKQVLAAIPLAGGRPLATTVRHFESTARTGLPAEVLRWRTVTNVACYAHASQPVEFFCCTCECYCVCAYCLTGFFPSGAAAAQSGAAGTALSALRTEDHTGHFLQAVDAAWTETILPRIEDEWGGPPIGSDEAAPASGDIAAGAEPAADAADAVTGRAGVDKGAEGGRGILGQVRGELELLQRSILQEKRREWARSLAQDGSTIETTTQLLLQRLGTKEQQLRTALETFTRRFCTECDEARARIRHQTNELQSVLKKLRAHKSALDPTLILTYYREQRKALEEREAADAPKAFRELPMSRKSVLQHSTQVTEELCGYIAELGNHVKKADGMLFEKWQQRLQQVRVSPGRVSPSPSPVPGTSPSAGSRTSRRPASESRTRGKKS